MNGRNSADESVMMTRAYLKLYSELKLDLDSAAKQIFPWVKNCNEAGSLIIPGSDIEMQIAAIKNNQLRTGIDFLSIQHIGFIMSIDNTSQRLLGIDCLGNAKISIGDHDGTNDVYLTSVGLSEFAMFSREVEAVAEKWLGEYIDSSISGSVLSVSIFVSVDNTEHCVSRWVYGSESKRPAIEIVTIIGHVDRLISETSRNSVR